MILAPKHQQWQVPRRAAGFSAETRTTAWADRIIRSEDQGVRKHFPGFVRSPSLHGSGRWRGQLRPMVQTYDVTLDMGVGCGNADLFFPWRRATVRVLGGVLRPGPNGEPVPHLYSAWDDPAGALLCLFYPPDETMLLGSQVAEKLLPWAYEWLYYYELWQVTGIWTGPEAPHDPTTDADMTPAPSPSPRGAGRGRRHIDAPLMRAMTYLIYRDHHVGSPDVALAA